MEGRPKGTRPLNRPCPTARTSQPMMWPPPPHSSPLCLDPTPLAARARSCCCQGTPAGRAGLAAGPLRTCSRPPLRLCRVLFLFDSGPSRPPPLCERRRITPASRRQKAVRDTPDAILTRPRSTATSTRRPAERPHTSPTARFGRRQPSRFPTRAAA